MEAHEKKIKKNINTKNKKNSKIPDSELTPNSH